MYWNDDSGSKGYVEMLPIGKRWTRALDSLFAWHPFYATIILSLERIAAETLPNGQPIPVMATNGSTLYWNPVTVPRMKQEDLIFVLVHEAEHIRLGHHLPLRSAALRDEDNRQHSADDAVNSQLIDELHVRCSPELRGFMCLPEKDGFPTGLAMEEYYELRRKQEQERQNDERDSDGEDRKDDPGDPGDADGGDGDSQDDESRRSDPDGGNDAPEDEGGDSDSMDSQGEGDPGGEDRSGDGSSPGNSGSAPGSKQADRPVHQQAHEAVGQAHGHSLGVVLPADTDDKTTPQDVENQWQAAITRAVVAAHEAGKLPGFIKSYAEDILSVRPLPWHRLLRPAIRALFPSGRTFARPSRRSGWRSDIILPERKRDGLGEVQFFTDTSGSMLPEDMEMTIPHIAGILKEFPKSMLRVRQFDTRLTTDGLYKRRDWKQIKPDEHEWKGRGGTDFRPMVDYINETKPKLAICLTDGKPCHGWGETRVPMIWLCTTDVVAPYGKTIRIRPEERGDA